MYNSSAIQIYPSDVFFSTAPQRSPSGSPAALVAGGGLAAAAPAAPVARQGMAHPAATSIFAIRMVGMTAPGSLR
jgi:hypothetical protein